jgi:hypothetical protein
MTPAYGAHACWWSSSSDTAAVALWGSTGGKGQRCAAADRPAVAMERHRGPKLPANDLPYGRLEPTPYRASWCAKRPPASRHPAPLSTAQEVVPDEGIPAAPPRAISPLARHTPPRARRHTTRPQHGARVVRAALSCVRKLANQIGDLTRCLGHDNLTRGAAEREHYLDITTLTDRNETHGALSV